MANTVVIVESPSKAKTISKYLGSGYTVRASMGHVRDLPTGRMGVEVETGTFAPEYELVKGRYKTISEIRELAKSAERVLLATDPDREGEAIAWHIMTAAGLNRRGSSVQRVEFHEITQNAVRKAVANPRALDMNLVNAQQARRVLDRLVGYTLSPLLWKKIQRDISGPGSKSGLSAGRVQSVALRIVVEREREIEAFVPREFWTVEADLAKSPWSKRKTDVFRATLFTREDKPKKWELDNGEQAGAIVTELEGGKWTIGKLVKKDALRRPSAPFITSTMQQEASRKLGMPSQRTMKVAQELYEGVSIGSEGSTGLITYMRTDSTNVAAEAQYKAREVIEQTFGKEYLPDKPPYYAKKVKGAQEAHEAIRPTKPERHPDSIKAFLTPEQYRLYRLIWQRFIASQMAAARLEITTVDVDAQPVDTSKQPYLFRAEGERVVFPGFLAVYREGRGDSDEMDTEKGLPPLNVGDLLDLLKLAGEQHFTQPPPRYGEASLVKALEELGVGRPSTYATILATIQDRGYVFIQGEGREKKFRPTELGRAVTDLLVSRFPDLFDVEFTAKLETELDDVAEGKRAWTPLVAGVYKPMLERLNSAIEEVGRISVKMETPPPTTAKTYSRGKGGGSRPSYARKAATGTSSPSQPAARSYARKPAATTNTETKPAARTYKPKAVASAAKQLPASNEAVPATQNSKLMRPSNEGKTQNCTKCNKPMVQRKGPYGEFWGCSGFPNCRNTIPIRA